MTIKINVGVNKKIGLPDYGSVGGSCFIEVEADNSVLDNSEQFLQRVKNAYEMARASVEEKLSHHRTGSNAGNNSGQSYREPEQQQQEYRPEYRNENRGDNRSDNSSGNRYTANAVLRGLEFLTDTFAHIDTMTVRDSDGYESNFLAVERHSTELDVIYKTCS